MTARALLATLLVAGCGSGGSDSDGATAHDAAVPADLAVRDFAPPARDLAANGPCDPAQQDCPNGQKCTLTDDGVSFLDQCLPDNGSAAPGDPCTRGDGGIGYDDCKKGALCSAIGSFTADDSVRFCRAFCHQDGDCPQGQACAGVGTSDGVCVARCALLGSDCATNFNCGFLVTDADGASAIATCRSVGATDLGGPCGTSTDCVADSICYNGQCSALCDDQHACAKGSCLPILNLPAGGGYCG